MEFFLNYLNKAINTYLNLDAESHHRFKKLNGKIITIHLLPFNLLFQCVFHENRMTIEKGETLPADTKISGTPLQLLAVSLTKVNRQQFFAKDLVIEGNAEVGKYLTELFDEIQIDWEEHLSQFIGDIPAYHTNRLLNKMKTWLNETEKSFTANVDEFCHEELKWFPPQELLQDFFSEVDQLRMDVDRLEARLALIQKRLNEDEVNQ